MSFNGDYAVTQGADLTGASFQDTSAGSDTNITARTIYLYTTAGALLVPPIDWPLSASVPFVVTGIMSKDYSLSAVVIWTSSSPLPSPSTYTKTEIVTFIGYTNQFIYSLIQEIAANNTILNDNDFQQNLAKIRNEKFNAIDSTTYSDQFSSQSALDRAQFLINNKTYFF